MVSLRTTSEERREQAATLQTPTKNADILLLKRILALKKYNTPKKKSMLQAIFRRLRGITFRLFK